jgi:UDP-N-acetylmuramate dehydrogenase
MPLDSLFEENKPLAPFTTLGIGGPARWFYEARTEEEIAEAAAWSRERGVKLFVLGGGSNLVVSDAGFDGLVLRVGLRGIFGINADCTVESRTPSSFLNAGPSTASGVQSTPDSAQDDSIFQRSKERIYTVAAGEDWDFFVARSVAENSAGIECLAGIPGTVGGTPVQNVGAYGQEVASVIERVRALDLLEHEWVELSSAECGFAYRQSRYNSTDRGRYVVTRVDYRLIRGGTPTLRYADLQRVFAGNPEPSLSEVADAVRKIRRSKGMLLVEGDPDCRSVGSFFKNPVMSEDHAARIAKSSGKEPPRFPAGGRTENGDKVKIPAAWLIEQAGFARGYALGGAGISSRHTLALINRGGATAKEILTLAEEIRGAVACRFGIELEMEPVFVGPE